MAVPPGREVAVVVRLNKAGDIDVSLIIPTLNEAENIDHTLQQIFQSHQHSAIEVLVSDGGSQDDTLQIAASYPCVIIRGAAGRAQQMNRAANLARGQVLLFLHADTQLPHDWYDIVSTVEQWGFFPLKLSGRGWLLRIVERLINQRSSLTRVASGDQTIFFRREAFDLIGGYDDIALMEDIAISKKIRQFYHPNIAASAVVTSSRRWETRGVLRTVLLMWLLRLAYAMGISPDTLHSLYYPRHRQ